MSVGSQRQGKAQAAGCWIRPAKRLAIYIRDGFTCLYCETDLRNVSSADITLDHITPRSCGGSNDATNLVTACRCCNSARGAKSVDTYATAEAIGRIEINRMAVLNIKLAKSLIEGE